MLDLPTSQVWNTLLFICIFMSIGIISHTALILVDWLTSPGALSALYLIDRQGRKRLLIGSYLGMVSGEGE